MNFAPLLVSFIRLRASSRPTTPDAEDLVQSFFRDFLKENYLQDLDSEKGRFRAFLLACFKNHSLNEWKRAGRQKRGGGADHLPFDWATADEKFQSQLMAAETPEANMTGLGPLRCWSESWRNWARK